MPRPKPLSTMLLPCLLLATLSGCEESDTVALQIRLEADGSGTVHTTSLSAPNEGAGFEGQFNGISWTSRARLVRATGTFKRLDELRMGEISFEIQGAAGGSRLVRVRIPRGPGRTWPGLLAPTAAGERERVCDLLDPESQASGLGQQLKIEFQLPGRIVSHGFAPASPKVDEEVEKKEGRAVLLVPVRFGLEAGKQDLVWHLTWQDSGE